MYITDLNNRKIEVTDLDEAISKSKEFMGYRHKDKSYADFDKRQIAYWTDLHKKLLNIKQRLDNN